MHLTMPHRHPSGTQSPWKIGMLLGSALLVLMTACGGDSSTTPATPSTTNTTAVQFNMGDAPADWLLSFTINVSSLSLTNTGGDTYYVSIGSVPVEMIQRLGTMEPVALAGIPQDSYSRANISIASCALTYLDPVTQSAKQATIKGPFTVSIPFDSAVKIDSTPYLFNFDLDLQHSLTTDGSGAFQFAPQFHHSIGVLDTSSGSTGGNGQGNGMNARYGGMYQMMGLVNSTTSSSFSIVPLQSANQFTFQVSQTTQFQGKIQQMSQLKSGMGVLVTALLQADGSLLATRVRATMSSGGAMGGGIITWVDTLPATELTIVMQNGAGASINTDLLSKTLTVKLSDTTTYQIDTDRISLDGLPFVPAFDASNIYAGQTVLPFSDEAIVANTSCDPTCGTINASTLRLREQGFRGTTDVEITPGATTSFTLTLMPDCAFTSLTGATSILVYQQASTNVEDETAIAVGATLRVHGLLFKNGGQWVLVASTISSV
jgi:hypothetical protein